MFDLISNPFFIFVQFRTRILNTNTLCLYMVLIEYSSGEEYDLEEEEHIALILMLHKSKKPNHGGSVFDVCNLMNYLYRDVIIKYYSRFICLNSF